jgi:hypothetical protein
MPHKASTVKLRLQSHYTGAFSRTRYPAMRGNAKTFITPISPATADTIKKTTDHPVILL